MPPRDCAAADVRASIGPLAEPFGLAGAGLLQLHAQLCQPPVQLCRVQGFIDALLLPVENRLLEDAGNQGLIPAKCAIAHCECLFLTSANLSSNAMAINVELGVCIHGGPFPEQVERPLRRSHRKGGSTGLRMSASARKAAPVAEVEGQVVCCVGESRCRGRSISESDPTVQTARKHNTTELERGCPGSREMRNRKD